MFKNVSFILLAVSTCLVLANEPISVTISGPHKIFTNDIVEYTATTEGSTPRSYTWSVTGGSGVPSGNTYRLTAPSAAANVTIQCTVTGSGNNPQSDSDTFNVTVVVPQITVVRESFDQNAFVNNDYGIKPGKINMGSNGTALIHKNGLCIDSEKLTLAIYISPSDVDTQYFNLTTSNNSLLELFVRDNVPYSPLGNYEFPNFSTPLSTYLETLSQLAVDGVNCGTGVQVQLFINNNLKLSLSYDIFGIQNSDFDFVTDTNLLDYYKTQNPGLVDNEWAIKTSADDSKYNCLAYAIKFDGKINNKFFWVKNVLPSNCSIEYANKFAYYDTAKTRYLTSIDIFGNNDTHFDASDIDNFFTNSFWGVDKGNGIVSQIGISRILYYNISETGSRSHAARKSYRTNGCHQSWHMFESKMGGNEIMIHRAEHFWGGYYGTIHRKYN